ncbi:MAG: lipopolysaccharide biosynthesis protein [Cryomorphaceae bacterium MED-G14]|nr:MAG: lipopolysaccharide biosynthesis protein [Cryomorphaceae bacterium MED-G14]|tara:strand:- start:1808 stop:2809 length:1002 start_codon:yes stop_codon:yes gene_type:complete
MRFFNKNHKNNKFIYYLRSYLSLIIPNCFFRALLKNKLSDIPKEDFKEILTRVNYYNKINNEIKYPDNSNLLSEIKLGKKRKTYFFDSFSVFRYFKNYKANFVFGDVNHVPEIPSFVKSRPISSNNQNSIILKLNKVRHFNFVNDNFSIEKKKNILFGRAAVYKYQTKRFDFYNKFFKHHLCDLGQINKGTDHDFLFKRKVSLDHHLKHKFILCIEGNDVASNLKWVMSSNSVAVMPKPKFETWFMEGKLIPDFHYIMIKDDYSDLEKKINYYIKNIDKLKYIISNANEFISKFRDLKKEKIISLLVMEKFFKMTNQKESLVNFFPKIKKTGK